MREADIQRAVFQYCELFNICAWRMPVGAVLHQFMHKGALKRVYKPSPIKGFPDMAGVISRGPNRGKFFVVEFKSVKGRVRPEQAEWLTRLTTAGAFAGIVTSVAQFEALMKEWGQV